MNKERRKIDLLISDAEFVVLDFETTGMKPPAARVIEIGMVKIKNGKIADTFASLINPFVPIPYGVTALTGITNSHLSDAPAFEDIAYEIVKFIGDAPVVAHNASFDYSFLIHELTRSEIEFQEFTTICTLKIAKRLHPKLKSRSLDSLRKHYRINHRNLHRALSDATVTAKLFLKMLKKLEEEAGIRTLDQLVKYQNLPKNQGKIRTVKKSLLGDLSSAPDAPGVYFWKDREGKIIYVGKAKSLKKRLNSYFLSTAERKAKKIIRKAKRIEFKETNTELTALLAETKLIKLHNPEFNSQLKKFPQTLFIKIDLTKKFPHPQITTKLKCDGSDYFGPYRNREVATDTLEIVNKAFKIRECNEREFSRKKKCYLAELERCLAPCVYPDKELYELEMKNVYEFLSGENQTTLNILLKKMQIYSNAMRFEEAAEFRDAAQRLLNQLKRNAILAEPINRAKALIEIRGEKANDYILFIEGDFYIKGDITQPRDFFERALKDYFDGTLKLRDGIPPENIEYFKIALGWLNTHRDLIKIYYLKNYGSLQELYFAMGNSNP